MDQLKYFPINLVPYYLYRVHKLSVKLRDTVGSKKEYLFDLTFNIQNFKSTLRVERCSLHLTSYLCN